MSSYLAHLSALGPALQAALERGLELVDHGLDVVADQLPRHTLRGSIRSGCEVRIVLRGFEVQVDAGVVVYRCSVSKQ
jgi:hypothetical protein